MAKANFRLSVNSLARELPAKLTEEAKTFR